jgi:phage baseplate assembly protein W
VAFVIDKENYKLDEEKTTYLGFKLPFAFGINSETLNTKTIDNVKDNLINLLLTTPGDRVFQPNLGVDISNLLFEQMGGDIDQLNAEMREEIETKVRLWMPFIRVNTIDTSADVDSNIYSIKVSFTFVKTPTINESVQVEIPMGGY